MTRPFYPAQTDYVEKLNALWDHVGILWRGDWDAGAAYEVGDLARYGKDVWRRLVAGTTAGAPSADLTNWELFVEGGIDGIDGTNGTNGTNGANGADGADGVDGVTPWVTPPVPWATTTIYTAAAPASTVTYDGESYVCSTSHTSGGSFDASKFTKIAAKGADGAGSGDVSGPASAVNNRVAFFDGTTGKLIKDSGLGLSGSNTGDQTSIVGITGTIAQFNTACTDADFATGGGTATGTNTGDQTSVTGNAGSATVLQNTRTIDGVSFNGSADISVIAPATHAATSKTTPIDADEVPLVDTAASNVLKRLTLSNLAAYIFSGWGPRIAAATGKTTPVNADGMLITDSASSGAAKFLSFTNLKAFLKTYFDTLYAAVGSGGGSMIYIDSGSVTSASAVDIESTIGDGTYDVYVIELLVSNMSSAGTEFDARLKIGGSYLTTNTYSSHSANQGPSNTYSGYGRSFQSAMRIAGNGFDPTDAGNSMNLTIKLFNPASTTKSKSVKWTGGSNRMGPSSADLFNIDGFGGNSGTGVLTGFRGFPAAGGTITASWRLYGIKNS